MPTPQHYLTRHLSDRDQVIADPEVLTVARCDDEALKCAPATLAELRETRESVEGKLRAQ
jgi:hypothetical protein